MPQHTTWDRWTNEDDARLVKWAGVKPDHVIAHLLGRTRTAVQQRAAKKGLSMCVGRTWVPVRDAEIRRAAALRAQYRFGTEAAIAMGVPYSRFQLLIKYAKKQGYI